MRKNFLVFLGAALAVLAGNPYGYTGQLQWEELGGGKGGVNTVLIFPDKPATIYFGSARGVFKSRDKGGTWRNVLSTGGQNKAVNQLMCDVRNSHFYAAGGNGLFESLDEGATWKKVYKGRNYLEADCTAVAALPYGMYLGTKGGLFVSRDRGVSWQKEARIDNHEIAALAFHPKEPQYLFAACVDAVFVTSDAGRAWKRIFVAHTQVPQAGEEEGPEPVEAERLFTVSDICIDQENPNVVWLATSKGVYRSFDKGIQWDLLSREGLLDSEVRKLLNSKVHGLLAMTKSAVFVFRQDRWQELPAGYLDNAMKSMALDSNSYLYIACGNGLFRTKLGVASDAGTGGALSSYLDGEPAINQVQEAAMRYAELQPEKIIAWRKKAAQKAWLPQVSAGVSRDTADLWHWEGGSTTKPGDDCLVRGRDSIEWDLRFTWDLGELVWNNDQTAIDVRSRLMVELRDDILDEVTKLYFERIRVKIELDNLKIEDKDKRFNKELRLKELEASLDALTGGYYSRALGLKAGSPLPIARAV